VQLRKSPSRDQTARECPQIFRRSGQLQGGEQSAGKKVSLEGLNSVCKEKHAWAEKGSNLSHNTGGNEKGSPKRGVGAHELADQGGGLAAAKMVSASHGGLGRCPPRRQSPRWEGM